jgi:hypothetical protein
MMAMISIRENHRTETRLINTRLQPGDHYWHRVGTALAVSRFEKPLKRFVGDARSSTSLKRGVNENEA